MGAGDSLLSGLLVIDCATYIAAPAAAVMLGDFGADVVKIERSPWGDPYRDLYRSPGMPICERDYCWELDNRGKKSLPLDLKQEVARQALDRLVARADVFITNYQPPLLDKFQLAYPRLRAINPRLVYAHVTGFGDRGPEVDLPAYDQTAFWARSGLMNAIHNAGGEPAKAPSGIGDHPTASALFGAIMAALYRRERAGEGARVSTSLLANGAWANSCFLQAELLGATYWPRTRRETCLNVLVNHYVARDGKRFLLCCLDPPKDWPNFCRAIGREELIDDPRYATREARTQNTEQLVARIDEAVAEHDFAHWEVLFQQHDVLYSRVADLAAAANDVQLQAAGVLPELDHPEYGTVRTVSSPVEIDGEAKVPPMAAPKLGQHTRELLASLGYERGEIDAMLASGATIESV